eukprot:9360899-Pyramimonas_sp.AAC.2
MEMLEVTAAFNVVLNVPLLKSEDTKQVRPALLSIKQRDYNICNIPTSRCNAMRPWSVSALTIPIPRPLWHAAYRLLRLCRAPLCHQRQGCTRAHNPPWRPSTDPPPPSISP